MKTKQILSDIKDYFVYDVWDPIRRKWNSFIWFFKNVKIFWKTLIQFRDWDFQYCVDLFIVGLERLAKRIENGNEEERSSNKKVRAIHKLIHELQRDVWEEAYEKFEKEEVHNQMCELQQVEDQLEEQRFNNVMRILHGRREKLNEEYREAIKQWETEHPDKQATSDDLYDIWVELFDGTGYDGWWE